MKFFLPWFDFTAIAGVQVTWLGFSIATPQPEVVAWQFIAFSTSKHQTGLSTSLANRGAQCTKPLLVTRKSSTELHLKIDFNAFLKRYNFYKVHLKTKLVTLNPGSYF
jgi:hypothetical protein